MKLNSNKTRVISFCRKTNWHGFDYKLCESSITCTYCIRDLGVCIDKNLHFHQQGDNISSQAIKPLGLIRTVTFPFLSLHSLLTLYYTSVRPKLEYASVVWNSVTLLDACKMVRILWKFISLCHHRFLSYLDYSCGNVLNCLKLHTFSAQRCYLVLFCNECFQWFKILSYPFGNAWPTCPKLKF